MTRAPVNLLLGDIAPHLWRLSAPLLWGRYSFITYMAINTIYISRLGTPSLAALGFTIPIIGFFSGFIFGLSIGTSSIISRAFGQGDHEKVKRLTTDSIVFTFFAITLCAIAGFFLADIIFGAMGVSDTLMPMIHQYMFLWYCGMPFLGISTVANGSMRGIGDTRYASAVFVVVALIAMALDPLLIFGLGGFPQLGLAGAALSITLANIIACLFSIYILAIRRKIFSSQLFHPESIQNYKSLLHVGIPATINNLTAPFSAAIITWMASSLGKEAVAAYGVISRIEMVATQVFYAISTGASVFSGQNYGAGNYQRIVAVLNISARYSLLWGGALAILFWIFGESIALFFDKNPLVHGYVTQYLHIVPISYAAFGLLLITNGIMNACGKPLVPTLFILLRVFFIYIPLAWIGREYAGLTGMLWALCITDLIVGTSSFLWNKKSLR